MRIALPVVDPDGARPPASPPEAARRGALIDAHGRTIRDLRLSITDRCNFRCVYCLEPDHVFLGRGALLSPEELLRVARVCVGLGIEKVRITGGEPTVHPRLDELIRGVHEMGVRDIAMTTNGWRCPPGRLRAWRDAGLNRLTVSLDSLREARFAAMTRSSGRATEVVEAIGAAVEAGLTPVRVNMVVMRGLNDDEVVDFATLARRLGVEVRFIEFMPLDDGHRWTRDLVVTADEILARIGARYALVSEGRVGLRGRGADGSSTQVAYRFADGAPGGVGMIAPVSHPFCGACSRLRITCDGKVRPCLFSRDEFDLRPVLRSTDDDDAVASFIRDAVWTKQAGHGIGADGFRQPDRTMSAIGGCVFVWMVLAGYGVQPNSPRKIVKSRTVTMPSRS